MRTFGGKLGPLSAGHAGRRGRRAPLLGQSARLSDFQRPSGPRHDPPAEAGQRRRAIVAAQHATNSWQFKVKPGVEQVRFGNPGSRLGYARDAVNSYFVFRTLREKGVLPDDLRFQISIPMVNSVIRPLYFPDPADLPRVSAGLRGGARRRNRGHRRQNPAPGSGDPVGLRLGAAGGVRRRQGRAVGARRRRRTCRRSRGCRNLVPEDVALGFHYLLRHVRRLAGLRARRSRASRSN